MSSTNMKLITLCALLVSLSCAHRRSRVDSRSNELAQVNKDTSPKKSGLKKLSGPTTRVLFLMNKRVNPYELKLLELEVAAKKPAQLIPNDVEGFQLTPTRAAARLVHSVQPRAATFRNFTRRLGTEFRRARVNTVKFGKEGSKDLAKEVLADTANKFVPGLGQLITRQGVGKALRKTVSAGAGSLAFDTAKAKAKTVKAKLDDASPDDIAKAMWLNKDSSADGIPDEILQLAFPNRVFNGALQLTAKNTIQNQPPADLQFHYLDGQIYSPDLYHLFPIEMDKLGNVIAHPEKINIDRFLTALGANPADKHSKAPYYFYTKSNYNHFKDLKTLVPTDKDVIVWKLEADGRVSQLDKELEALPEDEKLDRMIKTIERISEES